MCPCCLFLVVYLNGRRYVCIEVELKWINVKFGLQHASDNKHLLNTEYMPDTMLSSGDTKRDKRQALPSRSLQSHKQESV